MVISFHWVSILENCSQITSNDVYGCETWTVICQMMNHNALTSWKWSKSLSQNHKEQINQSTIKLSSSLQRAVNTENLTSMQINNWEQSGKERSKCWHLHGLFSFSFMQALKEAHSGRRAVYTLGKCHMEVLCGCVCTYMCWGYFSHEKKCNFSGQQTESFHDNLSNISPVNHTILAFHAYWWRREIMPFTSGNFLLSACILICSSKLILSYTNWLDI